MFLPIGFHFTREIINFLQGIRLQQIEIMNSIRKDKEGNPPIELTPDYIIPSRANNVDLNENLG